MGSIPQKHAVMAVAEIVTFFRQFSPSESSRGLRHLIIEYDAFIQENFVFTQRTANAMIYAIALYYVTCLFIVRNFRW